MKLNDNFIRHQVDGETLIVPTGSADFHGLIQGNKTLSAITECLTKDTTEDQIVDALCERFDGSREEIQADVHEAIKRLKSIGAIDE